jgi:hypothetical protein
MIHTMASRISIIVKYVIIVSAISELSDCLTRDHSVDHARATVSVTLKNNDILDRLTK